MSILNPIPLSFFKVRGTNLSPFSMFIPPTPIIRYNQSYNVISQNPQAIPAPPLHLAHNNHRQIIRQEEDQQKETPHPGQSHQEDPLQPIQYQRDHQSGNNGH